jgi:hypothetical protein
MQKKNISSLVAAAALAVAGLSVNLYAQDTPPADNRNAAERAVDKTGSAIKHGAEATGDAIKSAGEKTKDVLTGDKSAGATKHSEEINDVLAQVAEATATRGGLDDLVERFVDADRNRLGQDQGALKESDALKESVHQFQRDWKAKYNQDFDIKDEDALYNGFAMITEGEETGAQTASGKVDVDANANSNAAGGTASVKVDNNTGVDAPKANTDGQVAADKNLNDPGRNIATVTFPASHGMPEIKVPLIHEAGGWKIDIPDEMTAAKLRDNVSNVIAKCESMKDKWPADANEAYRGFTHKVLLSIFDKPLMDDAQKASDSQPPAVQPAANPQ